MDEIDSQRHIAVESWVKHATPEETVEFAELAMKQAERRGIHVDSIYRMVVYNL